MVAENLTQREAARRLGITTTWLRELTAREEVSRNDDRSYPWPKIRKEYEAFQARAQAERDAGHGDDEYEEQRSRLTRLKADAAEMENRIRRGELIDIADVEQLVREPLERVNAILKNVPAKYATKLARRSKIRVPEARALLSEIAEAIRTALRSDLSGGDDVAAD